MTKRVSRVVALCLFLAAGGFGTLTGTAYAAWSGPALLATSGYVPTHHKPGLATLAPDCFDCGANQPDCPPSFTGDYTPSCLWRCSAQACICEIAPRCDEDRGLIPR
jgi:hypothetical protein